MTPQQLEEYITIGDATGLTNAVKNLTETERRGLSKTAAALLSKSKEAYFNRFTININNIDTTIKGIWAGALNLLKRFTKKEDISDLLVTQYETAQLAAFALCPFSVVRRIDTLFGRGHLRDLFLKIITDRKPDWVEKWVEEQFKKRWSPITWEEMQYILKTGLCSKPKSDGYIQLMARDMPGWGRNKEQFIPISQKLQENPELLKEDVWRLFEVETMAFNSDWSEDSPGRPPNYESWTTALVKLAGENIIDRQRLIDGCILGLTAGFTKKDTLSGYINLHDCIDPIKEELFQRQSKYLELLSHSASHVITFAIKQLKIINKHKMLDDESFIRSVEALITSRTKSHSKEALSLLSQIIKRRQKPDVSILRIVALGLQHESSDIQEIAVGLLDHWLNKDHSELAEYVEVQATRVASNLQSKTIMLLQKLEYIGGQNENIISGQEDVLYKTDLDRRIDLLSENIRISTGVAAIRDTIERGVEYPPLNFDLYDAPILSGIEAVRPIKSLEELIESISHAIEQVDSAEEVERFIDGISRLCDLKPHDFIRNTAPLKKRIFEDQSNRPRKGLFGDWGAPQNMANVMMAWLCEKTERIEKNKFYKKILSPVDFIDARLNELSVRIVKKVPAPLLAAPTHRHGWIDPRVFVERIIYYQTKNLEILKYDFLQALLRLAPDFRKDALQQAKSITESVGDIVRWSLGNEGLPTQLSLKEKTLWIAAGRARKPRKNLDELHCSDTDMKYPDGIMAAQYEWRAYLRTVDRKWNNKESYYPTLTISNGIEKYKMQVSIDNPCTLLHLQKEHPKWYFYNGYNANSPWLVHWCGIIWPQNHDPYCTAAISQMIQRIDKNSSSDSPNFAYLEILFEQDRPLTEMATLMIWTGLASKDVDVRGHAIDLLAEAIQDGRVHSAPFGDVFIQLCAGNWVKLNRIYDALKEIVRFSALHAYVIAGILKKWLSSNNFIPEDGHYLLSLILELLTRLGWGLSEQEKTPLFNIQGAGKTTKLAKELLNYKPQTLTPEYHQALLQLLNARLNRAERWQTVICAFNS